MYKFLSEAFHAAARIHESLGNESAEAVAERRERWLRERQEKEVLAEFLMTSELGQRVAVELRAFDDAPVPPLKSRWSPSTAVAATPALTVSQARRQGTDASGQDEPHRQSSAEQRWSTRIEKIVFDSISGARLARGTAALLKRAGADVDAALAVDGRSTTASTAYVVQQGQPLHSGRVVGVVEGAVSSPSSTVSRQLPASDVTEASTTARPIGRGTVVTVCDAAGLPVRLLVYLVQRWRRAVLTTSVGSSDTGESSDHARRVRDYLVGVLPLYCALLSNDDATSASYCNSLLEHGIEGAIAGSLRVLFPPLASAAAAAAAHPASSPTGRDAATAAERAQSLALVDVLLHLLKCLHFRGLSTSTSATGLPTCELAQGAPANAFRLAFGFPDLSDVKPAAASSVAATEVDWKVLEQERCRLARDLAVTYLTPLAKCVTASSAGEAGQSKEEPTDPATEADISFANCTCAVFLLLLPIRVASTDVNTMVSTVVVALSILLARWVSEPPSVSVGNLLLRQISCGLLLATQLLRECPGAVVEAMNNAGFFDNLLNFLLCLGMQCESGEHASASCCERSEALLRALASNKTLQTIERCAEGEGLCCPTLERPVILRVAANSCADECLHCYLGLLTARRHVCTWVEITSSTRLGCYLDQLELALMKVFLVAAAAGPLEEVGASLEHPSAAPTDGTGDDETAEVRAAAPAAAMRVAARLHSNSCLCDLLVKYALSCLPERRSGEAPSPPPQLPPASSPLPHSGSESAGPFAWSVATSANTMHYCRLVDCGLYRILLKEETFFSAFRHDPRLLYATTFLLLHMLTLEGNPAAPDNDDEDDAATAVRRGVDPEVEAILSSSFVIGRATTAASATAAIVAIGKNLSDTRSSRRFTTSFLSTELAWRDPGTAAPGSLFVTTMAATLVYAIRGPRSEAVHAAMMAESGFRVVGHVALKLASVTESTEEVPRGGSEEVAAPALARAWVLQAMAEMLKEDAVLSNTLTLHTDVVLGLLLQTAVRTEAEQMLVALLCYHNTTAPGLAAASATDYVRQMQPLVTQFWAVLSQCGHLTGASVIDETTSSSPGLDCLSDAAERDAVFLSLLRCLRIALARLRSGPLKYLVTPARALQHILCDPQSIVNDGFLRLIHRASQPWAPAEVRPRGLRAILATITALIKGNPAMRAVLLQKIGPREFVACFKNEWIHGVDKDSTTAVADWQGFVHGMLSVVYERGAGLGTSTDGDVDSRDDGDAMSSAACGTESIQNAEFIAPLISCFSEADLFSSNSDESTSEAAAAALVTVLRTLLHTMRTCRASLFLACGGSITETLAQLLPAAAKSNRHPELLSLIASVMKLAGSHHVDVRQIKLLLMSIVHAASVDDRITLAPVVMDIISAATAGAAWAATGGRQTCGAGGGAAAFDSRERDEGETHSPPLPSGLPEPQGYIALRRGCGVPGIKAVLPEFSTEGYTVCMWLRIEVSEAEQYRTIFCIQNPERRTVLELRITSAHTLSVAFQDSQRIATSVDLDCALLPNQWTHLSLVHRPPNYLTGVNSNKALAVYVNGCLTATSTAVPYPPMAWGYVYVGIAGEGFEQRSLAHALTAQVTSLYLLGCSLGSKEAAQFFTRECGITVSSPSAAAADAGGGGPKGAGAPAVSGQNSVSLALAVVSVLERMAATVVGVGGTDAEKQLMKKAILCVDPRLAEKDNRLYNVSAVLKGRQQRESTLTTCEGTMVCNTTNALDAVCVLGALPTVVMPFVVLLVNVTLPFSKGGFAPTAQSKGVVATQRSDAAVHHVLTLLDALTEVAAVRMEMASTGLFALLAAALEEVAPLLGMRAVEHLLNLCTMKLLTSQVLFETAYTNLFLSAELLRACPPETQLICINCQRAAVSTDDQVRAAVRATGAQQFLTAEILHVLKVCHRIRHRLEGLDGSNDDDDDINNKKNNEDGADGGQFTVKAGAPKVSLTPPAPQKAEANGQRLQHAHDMLEQLLSLLECLVGSPAMVSDALAIQTLVSASYQCGSQVCDEDLIEVLRRVRLLLCSREARLCQYLGRQDYIADLLLFVRSADVSSAVRLEALLQLLLLIHRSRRTQELMNPALLANKGGAHMLKDVSLGWIKHLLWSFPVDTAVYMTLRCALVADFGAKQIPCEYAPLASTDALSMAAVVTPIMALMKRSSDTHLTSCALTDLLFLVKHDSQAWRRLLEVPGWYIQVVSLYTAELQRQGGKGKAETTAAGAGFTDEGSDVAAGQPDGDSIAWDQRAADGLESGEATLKVSSAIFATSAALLSNTLFHALTSEMYGAAELEAAVTYMEEQGVVRLLTQVLTSIAEKFHTKLITCHDASVTNFLGLGTNTALVNFTAFVYCVEDVLFYSQHAVGGGGSSASNSPGSTGGGAGGSLAAASETLSPLGGGSGKAGKSGYTEWDELKLVYDADTAPQTLGTGEHKLLIVTSPDGHWIHLDLALKLADLLATNATLLNCGGTTLAGSTAEALFATGAQYRTGGFLRIFCRLVRVAASMTLRAPLPLDAIVLLLDRYVRLVDGAASVAFQLFKRRPTTLEKAEMHSSMTVTMTLFYVVHDLLSRRLRASEAHSGTAGFSNINAELLDKLKCLFLLFRKPFEAMPCFTGSNEGDGSNASERQVRRERTTQWLATRSFSNMTTAPLEAFAEVASRGDYNAFTERCMLTMEKDQLTDKKIAGDVTAKRQSRLIRLQTVIADLAVGEQAIVESLQRLTAEHATGGVAETPEDIPETSPSMSPKDGSSFSSRSGVLQPRVAAARMTSTVRASVWTRFLEAIKGTIWNVDPPGAKAVRKYVKLSNVEQQPLVHRKLLLSRDGTSHRAVTERGQRCSPPPPCSPTAAQDEDLLADGSSRLRLRGGEAVLLENRGGDDEDPFAVALASATSNGNTSATDLSGAEGSLSLNASWTGQPGGDVPFSSVPGQRPLQQQQLVGSPLTQLLDEEAAALPVLLSIPCEVPLLMHCWSATFTIRGGDICVLFDEENRSYNQRIADEAQPFLTKPQSFSISAANIVQIAPARRFRMRRTGVEMWLRDRRSCFVNFPDAAVMRVALQKICQVAVSQQRRGVGASGRAAPPTFVASVMARGFYVFQENPLREPLRIHCMQQWQNGELSNFDYLLWLNVLSGRSVNDITQYPVFPWIIADYTSETLDLTNPDVFRDLRQPIGVCGEKHRRDVVKRRYEEMKMLGDVPAHYFTHYSSPAVVIYFMVRLEPFTTLQLLLQGGHFDHADRMFHCLRSTYRAVTTSTQDTRELIPELYYLPEVCTNNNDVNFGTKQDGSKMNHLQLPPWAHGSPHEFIYHMRAALESEHVSAHLNHWIDLIFGAMQRGKEAIEALNVFNWHSYEDLDRHRGDTVDQQLLTDSLDNIGQTPIQLFRQPHCARRPRALASALECAVRLKKMHPLLGVPQRIALVSLEVPEKLLVVGSTGIAVSFKLTVQPLKRPPGATASVRASVQSTPAQPTHHRDPVTSPEQQLGTPTMSSPSTTTANVPSVLHSVDPSVTGTGTSPTTAGAPAFSLPPPVGGAALSHPAVRGASFGGPASGSHGGFELFSFDVSEEFDRKIPAVPSGLIPNHAAETTGATAAAAAASTGSAPTATAALQEGPCTRANTAVLCFGAEAYIVLGGMYDNSVVIRALSGLVQDVRLVAHRGRVVRLAVSGDSQFLVTGAEDTTFVVWCCAAASSRRSPIDVQLLFTIYGHEDNPTAAQVSSALDLVATASRDGALMLHSLSSGSLDRTVRHPHGHSIDMVLVQSSCYVPNVLYASHTDNVIHQISINGTPLRSFTPPGRLTSWTATSEQFLILTCAPHNRGFTAKHTGSDDPAAAEDPQLAAANLSPSSILYLHSFFLTALRAVALPTETEVQSLAVHPRSTQVVVLGTKAGELLLLRSTVRQSTVL